MWKLSLNVWISSAGPAERERGVQQVLAVAGDVDLGVARERHDERRSLARARRGRPSSRRSAGRAGPSGCRTPAAWSGVLDERPACRSRRSGSSPACAVSTGARALSGLMSVDRDVVDVSRPAVAGVSPRPRPRRPRRRHDREATRKVRSEEPGATTERKRTGGVCAPDHAGLQVSRARSLDRQSEVAREDQALDLARSLADLEDLRVAVEAARPASRRCSRSRRGSARLRGSRRPRSRSSTASPSPTRRIGRPGRAATRPCT